MRRFPARFTFCLALSLGPAIGGIARADEAAPASAASKNCDVRNVEYALSARLKLSDTAFGAGNGVYDIGPGRLVLRLTTLPDSPNAYLVELMDFRIQSRFTVRSKVLLWKARVITRTQSHVTEGVAGRGRISDKKLTWSTPIEGYTTDGTLTCTGSGCGMPGAPPDGDSPLHVGPHDVRFSTLIFNDDDLNTFQMGFVKLSHTDQPRQTTHMALAGRKVVERCAKGS